MAWMGVPDGMHSIRTEPGKSSLEIRQFEASYIPRFKNAGQFIEEKIDMLRNHFNIDLTYEDIAHLCELKTENEINAAVKGILNKYWE